MISEHFTMEQTAESAYLTIAVDNPAALDSIAMQVLREDMPDFLVPFSLTTENGVSKLRYRLATTTTLSSLIGSIMPRRRFTHMALELLTPFIRCKNWFLDYHSICIDPSYIFYDKAADRYQLIYVPKETYINTDSEIVSFFKSVLTSIDILDNKNCQHAVSRYFKGNAILLPELHGLITELDGEIVPEPTPRTADELAAMAEPAPTPAPIPTPAPMPEPAPADENVAARRAVWSLFRRNSEAPAPAPKRRYLELIECAAPEPAPDAIELDGLTAAYITIGRAASAGAADDVDVVFPRRCGVSRHHMRIHVRDDRFFAEDLGSSYFTLLDGKKIEPGTQHELKNGAILTLVEREPIRYRVHL